MKGNVKYGQGYAMQETMQMAASMHRDGGPSFHGAAMQCMVCGDLTMLGPRLPGLGGRIPAVLEAWQLAGTMHVCSQASAKHGL